MNKLQSRLISGLLLVSWMGGIYFFSDQPNSNKVTEEMFGNLNYFVRKAAHITEYGVLYFLAYWFQNSFWESSKSTTQSFLDPENRITPDLKSEVLGSKSKGEALRQCIIPVLFSIAFAISDEWHQSFVPGRSSLVSDILIDSLGIAIAALLGVILA